MGLSFSSKYIDPLARGREFYLEVAKGIGREWTHMDTLSFSKGYDRYKRNQQYSNGSQSPSKYMDKFKIDDDPDTSYMNIDWQVPPILPKFRRIALEKIGRYDFDIVATAIDTQAKTDRDKYEAEETANIMLRNALAQAGVDSGVLDTEEPDQPKNFDDLKLKMEFTYKHRDASNMERRIDAVFTDNKVNEELRHLVRRQLFDTGVCGMRDEYDPQTGKVKIRILDPSGLGMSPTRDPNFRDCVYFFEKIYMTPNDIEVIDTTNEFDAEDMVEIADRFAGGKYGRSGHTEMDEGEPYTRSQNIAFVPVWDIEVKVLNRVVWEKRLAVDGDRIGKIDYSDAKNIKKGNDYSIDDQYVWLKMRWIEGTDWIFNYGPVPNLKRPFSSRWDAEPTFHIVASELEDMETVALVDNLKPIVDDIIFAWYKLRNVIMTARPKGIAIEIGSLEGVQIGATELDPLALMDMFDNTGRLWYRKMTDEGDPVNYRPIEELDNGLGNEASEWFGIIDKYFNYIRDMLGFNEFTDASTPNPKSLVRVGDMATANTDNALNHIFRSEREILRRLAESVAIRIHDAIAFEGSDYYTYSLGKEAITDIEKMKEGIERQYGIFIIDSGNDREKQQLEDDMAFALQNGQITIADKEVIKHIRNIKQAEMYLAIRVKQNMEEEKSFKKELQLEAAQANADAGLAVQQAKDQSINVEYDRKKELEILKSQLKREEMQLEAELEMQGSSINNKLEVEKERELSNIQEPGNPVEPVI
ncbi:MAG: hypothetical protein DRI46_06645 [Chloroflexi bacterium]|nr:MAG: hypothetical protein DRI46_06645 [Chloroflexota bacterium]